MGESALNILILLCFYLFGVVFSADSTSVKVINYAGAPINLYWINTFSKAVDFVPQTKKPIRNNTDATINSYNTHQFEVRFLDERIFGEFSRVTFTKGPEDETVMVKFDEDTNHLILEQVTDIAKMMEFFDDEVDKCYEKSGSIISSETFSNCIADSVIDEVARVSRTKAVLRKYQDIMSHNLKNYTCHEEEIKESEMKKDFNFRYLGDLYRAKVFLDTPHSQIYSLDRFVKPEECSFLRNHHDTTLEASSMIGNKADKSVLYEVRSTTDPLWSLWARSIYLMNHRAHYNILPFAGDQAGIEIKKYKEGSEIPSHCEGACNGEPFVKGDYVGSVIFDCEVPVKGGELTFAHANVYLKPTLGRATFITFKGPDNHMDEGYTEYGSCPIRQGERYFVRMVLREGTRSTSAPSLTGTANLGNKKAVPDL